MVAHVYTAVFRVVRSDKTSCELGSDICKETGKYFVTFVHSVARGSLAAGSGRVGAHLAPSRADIKTESSTSPSCWCEYVCWGWMSPPRSSWSSLVRYCFEARLFALLQACA
eukprot:352550-Chlamydomonas_euryale.AAC.13